MVANPVVTKELRQRMRGNRAMIVLTVYLTGIGIVTLLVYMAVVSSLSFGASDLDAGRRIGKAIFITVIGVALAQVCLIAPALSSASIAGEKERQTFDLLTTTLLTPWQIVVGKLVGVLAFAMLMILATLPLAALAFLFGGVSGTELLIAVVGLVITAILFGAVGMFFSALMRTVQGAASLAQGAVLLWLLGIPFLFIVLGTILDQHDGGNALFSSPLTIYMMGAMLCSHPFIALGVTEALIADGENPFFFTLRDVMVRPGATEDLLAPSPWLGYVFMGLLLALILLALSVRLLQQRSASAPGMGWRRLQPAPGPAPAPDEEGAA